MTGINNEQFKIAEFKHGSMITRVYILKPLERFERFAGSRHGLIVKKTPSLIVTQSHPFGRNDTEYDVHDLKIWKRIFEIAKQSD